MEQNKLDCKIYIYNVWPNHKAAERTSFKKYVLTLSIPRHRGSKLSSSSFLLGTDYSVEERHAAHHG